MAAGGGGVERSREIYHILGSFHNIPISHPFLPFILLPPQNIYFVCLAHISLIVTSATRSLVIASLIDAGAVGDLASL